MSRHATAKTGKTMLGRYRIERELGRGGMGVVYVATDVNTDRLVALKTTTVAGLGSGEKTRNQRRERFIREVKALTQINHENVVHVFDAGEIDDPDLGWLLFYTMEYVEGTTLASLVQERGALSGGEAAAVVSQVALGLGEAHKQGIIHRDVKPANIFLSNDGRALIGDFGIAKLEGSTQITRRDQLVGTPNYLAPEQILGEPVASFTDVFALGALFYVITQNRPLRQQVDASALLASANGNDPVQRALAAQGLSDGLRKVLARALERDPARRYVDGTAFAEALADHATRVPLLSPEHARPTFLNEGTLDRSSAFASGSIPSAEQGDVDGPLPPFDMSASDASSIEAMAQAMLGEVERRSTGTFKQQPMAQAPAPAPALAELPVARSESTVMFNMRALEDAPKPKAPLPVAKAEATQITRPTRVPLEPLSQPDEPPVAPKPKPPVAVVVPREPPSSAAAPVTSTPPELTQELPLRRLPRGPLLVASLLAGIILGVTTAVALAPEDVLAKRGDSIDDLLPSAPLPKKLETPKICQAREKPPTDRDRAEATHALGIAVDWKKAGDLTSKILDELRRGIALDNTNPALFDMMSTFTKEAPQEAKDAATCVCVLDPEGKPCASIRQRWPDLQ